MIGRNWWPKQRRTKEKKLRHWHNNLAKAGKGKKSFVSSVLVISHWVGEMLCVLFVYR